MIKIQLSRQMMEMRSMNAKNHYLESHRTLDGNDVLDLDDIFPRLSHSTILPWLRLLAVNG
jgi:hypothetical protein